MDFVHILEQVPTWKASSNTYKVQVTDPENYLAYMVEIVPINQRHLVDTIHKIQPLLSWTENKNFAKVLLAFTYDLKYFILYEYFEQEDRIITFDEAQQYLDNTLDSLDKLYEQGIYHGDICKENLKITPDGIKIVGWKLPKMRTFDPEPDPDWYQVDRDGLRQSLSEITKIPIEDFTIKERPIRAKFIKKAAKVEVSAIEEEKKGVWFINGKFLKIVDEKGISKTVFECKIQKGSSLIIYDGENYSQEECNSLFKGEIVNSGGEDNPYTFQKLSLVTHTWIPLSPLLFPHKHHTSIIYKSQLWIIGGINSSYCEYYSEGSWNQGPSLTESKDNPTCSIYNNILYVFCKGIEKLVDNEWRKIITFEWVGCMGIIESLNRIFILGGRTYSNYNSKVLMFNEENHNIEEFKDGDTGMYGMFGYLVNGKQVVAVNNGGRVKMETLVRDIIQ
ncbi:hypothetical protein SteCoe_3086 [Stentor coeruleus]|uniref:Protein kinase domain-containing protein n=1 Tax=Stentor coeruleus TaxID=5963 RepID=A0A1R2CY57_9CILI|nr:hypothetical protein SteCoe_3086 [Stentor coeruleus]